MKSKFLSGFLAGMLVTGLLSGAVFGVFSISHASANLINSTEVKNKVNTIENQIDKYYIESVDKNTLADGIYSGMLESLGDPYAAYYNQKDFASLMESTNGIYCGIGATVSQDTKTGAITIVKPFAGSPAQKAGILPGDIVYKIDGKEVTGQDLSEVVSRMKGEEGTKVKITIVRKGKSEPMEFTIKRKQIEVPTIESEMLAGKIGYIAVSEFDEITSKQYIKAVDDLEAQGAKGLVIDLRDNGGGLYDTAVSMLERMLPKGLLVYTEDKYGNKEEAFATKDDKYSKPVVILMNGNTASASEIFAGAMQDYKAATLVGTQSFGKGIVQSVVKLYDASAIKFTVAKYYTPKGRNIHGKGITPDVKVELKDSLKQKVVIEKSEDNQLQKAIEVLKKQMK